MEGFVAYDADWRMTYINASGERLLGRRREEVLGKTWHQAFPHALGNPVDEMYQRVMHTRQAERMEYYYPHYGRWLEISASPVRSGGVAVYFRDISDRETLNRIGRTLTAELDLERVVQVVTDAATEVSGAQFGAFFYNQKNEAGESYMLYTLSGVPREAFAAFPMPRNTAVFAPTFAGTGIVRADDITQDARYGKSGPHHGMPKGHLPVRSYLAVPVVSRSGEVLGGLFFGHPEPDRFTQNEERLVAGVAAQAAIAIDNARLFDAVQKARESAEIANRLKDEFLATVSHELRTPLNAVLGWTALLRDNQMDAARRARALETIERNARLQQKIVEDILDVTRIIAGQLRLEREPMPFRPIVAAAVESIRPMADDKSISLTVDLGDDPAILIGDEDRKSVV